MATQPVVVTNRQLHVTIRLLDKANAKVKDPDIVTMIAALDAVLDGQHHLVIDVVSPVLQTTLDQRRREQVR
jgi:hypothetical protein